jgi:hypothetical protein
MTAVTAAGKTERARENRAIVRRLLSANQPEFLAALQLAERHVDRELSGDSPAGQTPGWISQVLIIRLRRAA